MRARHTPPVVNQSLTTPVTPGPCTLREFDPVDGYFVLISDANGELFAKAYDPSKARLIAATPELLKQLQRVMDVLGGECFDWAPVRNAIAKATGSTT